ncbi:MAG: HAD family hydrolase [Proteobacteria bacterium]|nr:HAD family hydrolase [Pseudomonadota bacterium]
MDIKAILFDFGGTLDSDGIDWFPRIYGGVLKQVQELDFEVFQICARQAADELSRDEGTGRLNMDQTVFRLCEVIHNELRTADPEYGEWNHREVAEEFVADAHDCLERNQEVLRKLNRKYRLGCISNNWGNVAGWCRQYQLDSYFETMIDSALVGSVKPDRIIFQTALNEMGLSPRECIYVGDNYSCDVLGAHAVGMKPIWITNGDSTLPESNSLDPLRISKLSDLLDGEITAA